MTEYYWIVKQTHVTTVVLTLSLFILRGLWMLADSPRLQRRWVKIVPHVIDTLLLASGLTLGWIIQQYPFVHTWLTAKVVGLVAYIGLGTIALKRGRSKTIRTVAWIGALLVFGYIVSVALYHSPWGFLKYY